MVAFSAGAGLGLSSLHKFSMADDTALLQQPVIDAPSTSGFVLPDYVPTLGGTAMQAPALPEQDVTADPSPVIDVTPVPQDLVEPQASAPAPAAPLKARTTVRTIDVPEPTYDRNRLKARASITETQFFNAETGQLGPSYVVGVYR